MKIDPENSSVGPGERTSCGAPGGRPSRSSSVGVGPPAARAPAGSSHPAVDAGDAAAAATMPQVGSVNKKKKKGPQVVNGDKSGRGLRQFSMKVCEKVESKGRTTYNEVADELVAEFANLNSNFSSPDQKQYEEKNIRRRVYDALNVLMAMDILSKDRREIQWKGLPGSKLDDMEELKAEHVDLRKRIQKKAKYLKELQQQYTGLQNLVERNKHLYDLGNTPSGGVALPFILIQTRPHATVEVEISEDMQMVHFDLNSTPFELHDDTYIIKKMGFCGNQADCEPEHLTNSGDRYSSFTFSLNPSMLSATSTVLGKLPGSPPIPGILKPRPKHEPIE